MGFPPCCPTTTRGIHTMGNAGGEAAASVHLCGPKIGAFDCRDYDSLRDRVCERTEA
jgi:hypothetical protein